MKQFGTRLTVALACVIGCTLLVSVKANPAKVSNEADSDPAEATGLGSDKEAYFPEEMGGESEFSGEGGRVGEDADTGDETEGFEGQELSGGEISGNTLPNQDDLAADASKHLISKRGIKFFAVVQWPHTAFSAAQCSGNCGRRRCRTYHYTPSFRRCSCSGC